MAERKALMQGDHRKLEGPYGIGRIYCLLLDVAGEDELLNASDDYPFLRNGFSRSSASASLSDLSNPGRDSTALTVVEVDLSTLEDELIGGPRYRVVNRYEWVGTKHTQLYGRVKDLAEHWRARYLVVDATGVGAGLA